MRAFCSRPCSSLQVSVTEGFILHQKGRRHAEDPAQMALLHIADSNTSTVTFCFPLEGPDSSQHFPD